jgi:hypothetical protein
MGNTPWKRKTIFYLRNGNTAQWKLVHCDFDKTLIFVDDQLEGGHQIVYLVKITP